jgi:flavin-dependent dehydrogenase
MARVFVMGGGPAGSVFACRMAELGHDVTLAEQQRFRAGSWASR